MIQATTYDEAMDAITASWQHLIDALRTEGVDAAMWQTGGWCMAIGWSLGGEAGWTFPYAMLTSYDGPLEHDRADERRADGTASTYYVGVYLDEDDTGDIGFSLPMCRCPDPADDAVAARHAVAIAAAMYDREKATRG